MRRSDGTSHASDRVVNGTHHMLGGEIQSKIQKRRVNDGTHNWLGDGTIQRELQNKLVIEGRHHFQHKIKKQCIYCKGFFDQGNYKLYHGEICSHKTGVKRIFDKIKCPHCEKIGGVNAMKRWHFQNCKLRS